MLLLLLHSVNYVLSKPLKADGEDQDTTPASDGMMNMEELISDHEDQQSEESRIPVDKL